MAVYNKSGNAISNVYGKGGNLLSAVYDKSGNLISGAVSPYIYGDTYPLSEMTYTDEDSVTSTSALHVRNASTSICYAPTVKGNVSTTDSEREWVVFTCNISTNGTHAGIWIYTPPESCIVYGGKSSKNNGLIRLKVKLNSTSYTFANIKAGMYYYRLGNPPATITSISVSAINYATATSLTCAMYLDSIEVGFSARRAHVMFNLDCVPSNFMSVGYPLFEEFGLKCTLQYHISNTDSTAGADSTYLDTTIHNQLVAAGYDYATYSGWKSYEGDSTPFYDDDTKTALFEAHAERMWTVNNDSGIYAPSCIHGTGFLWGYAYNNACRDYPFLMIRRGNTSTTDCLEANYDPEFRTMIPYFLEDVWTAEASKIGDLKTLIDNAITTKRALQIGCHQIMSADYDTSQSGSGIYVNETAMREVLSYVKTKVNSGDIVCCTTAEYVAEMEPTVYADWLAYRQHQVA